MKIKSLYYQNCIFAYLKYTLSIPAYKNFTKKEVKVVINININIEEILYK